MVFRSIAIVWYALHIPITLLVDAQIVLPRTLFPTFALYLADVYVQRTFDPFVRAAPAFIRALVWCELLLQLPFFIVALYAYAKKLEWIRIWTVVYGVHTSTTLAPILFELWNVPTIPTDQHRLVLTGIYLPYLLVPLFLGSVELRRVHNTLQSIALLDRKRA
mmetsp:Transcript_34900/g.76299  ORF Transcript_34900/g.76299 Transcript_34900/m.76299 type:complete len:163 (+) Transcript_34900:46-534(+)